MTRYSDSEVRILDVVPPGRSCNGIYIITDDGNDRLYAMTRCCSVLVSSGNVAGLRGTPPSEWWGCSRCHTPLVRTHSATGPAILYTSRVSASKISEWIHEWTDIPMEEIEVSVT